VLRNKYSGCPGKSRYPPALQVRALGQLKATSSEKKWSSGAEICIASVLSELTGAQSTKFFPLLVPTGPLCHR
jgi:hypothetical protein